MSIVSKALHESGELQARIEKGRQLLEECRLCPRTCRVNRLEGEVGFCEVGPEVMLSSFGPHFGEESVLVGEHGSGTIFFTSCNLRCCFCQNHEISFSLEAGREVTSEELADIMLQLQGEGSHNINLVTPSHQVVGILQGLEAALDRGLDIPLVYNCGGYESQETLALLDGLVDIYMPDFKFWDVEKGRRYCQVGDYPETARATLHEMHRQVGDLMIGDDGLARRGLLVRHLLMPGGQAETQSILGFLADEISPSTYINLMDQYRPCADSDAFEELGRTISAREYEQARTCAGHLGLKRLDEKDFVRFLKKLGLF